MNELRTPMQPLKIQNIGINDSVVINEDRTGEDYYKLKNDDRQFDKLYDQSVPMNFSSDL